MHHDYRWDCMGRPADGIAFLVDQFAGREEISHSYRHTMCTAAIRLAILSACSTVPRLMLPSGQRPAAPICLPRGAARGGLPIFRQQLYFLALHHDPYGARTTGRSALMVGGN